jgi:hypothetical protein
MPLFSCPNMWEIVAIVELLERKGLCTKQDPTASSPSSAGRILSLNLAARYADNGTVTGLARSYKEEGA